MSNLHKKTQILDQIKPFAWIPNNKTRHLDKVIEEKS